MRMVLAADSVALDVTEYPYLLEADPDLGAGEVQYEEIGDGASDGEYVTSGRASNRTVSLAVWVEGYSPADLEANCAALERVLDLSHSTVRVDDHMETATPFVLEVARAQSHWERTDNREAHLMRRFVIEFPAAPWVRAVDPVTIPALPPATTQPNVIGSIYDGSTIAGWSGEFGTTVSPAPGGGVAGEGGSPFSYIRLTKPITLPAGSWVQVEVGDAGTFAPIVLSDDRRGISAHVTDGGFRYWYTGSSVRNLSWLSVLGGSSGALIVRSIDILDARPFASSAFQQFRTIEVEGTVRTTGSLRLSHPTQGLGNVTAYVCSDQSGYQPPQRRNRVSGGAVTNEGTSITGKKSALAPGSPEVYDVSNLPLGLYRIIANVRSATTQGVTFTVSAGARVGSTTMTPATRLQYATLTANQWTEVDMGTLTMPPTAGATDGATLTRVTIASDVAIDLDEVWLYNMSIGSLVRVKCGTGAPDVGSVHSELWIDAPATIGDRPAIWVNAGGGRESAYHVDQRLVTAWDHQAWPPGPLNIFTVAPGAISVDVQGKYYPRSRHALPPKDA